MTVTCGYPAESLVALIDGTVGGAEREALDTHLSTCATCRDRLERFRAMMSVVEDRRAPTPRLQPISRKAIQKKEPHLHSTVRQTSVVNHRREALNTRRMLLVFGVALAIVTFIRVTRKKRTSREDATQTRKIRQEQATMRQAA